MPRRAQRALFENTARPESRGVPKNRHRSMPYRGSVIYPNCTYYGGSLEFFAVNDELDRYFPCTHCGAQCPCPVRLVEQYAGRKVTRWCSTCGHLFDIEMPPKETPRARAALPTGSVDLLHRHFIVGDS